ncbi:ABC transporter permease [Microlunatus ginsengisoli]|uniref:Transport permease protein n=1 Tax=Microlunatus ginsengisoli TaxID=363863 RepID=A0ABP7ADD3_9ACTN
MSAPAITAMVHDTRAVFIREMSLILRDPFSIIFSLIQPLVFLGLFGPLLAGSIDPTVLNGASPLQWFLPGVVVMICLFGTSMTGSNLLYEISLGSYERTLAAPIHRSAILVGRSLKELAPLVVQAAIIVLVSIPFGFVLYPVQVIAGLLLLGVFGVGMGALSNALAIAARKSEWLFWGVQQSLLFPLLILSGMMLPLEAGPRWMQVIGAFNPLTYIVNAERALFSGSFTDPSIPLAVLAALITCALGMWAGIAQVRRSTT